MNLITGYIDGRTYIVTPEALALASASYGDMPGGALAGVLVGHPHIDAPRGANLLTRIELLIVLADHTFNRCGHTLGVEETRERLAHDAAAERMSGDPEVIAAANRATLDAQLAQARGEEL